MRLLIVKDERATAGAMMLNLRRVDYEREYAQGGEMGAAMMEKQSYDLVLLDIMLPRTNSYEPMEYLIQLQIPVIFITVGGSAQDRVKGLHTGADNYSVKPSVVDELMAGVRSALRRYHKGMQDIHVLDVTAHTTTRLVKKENRIITLIKKEYRLLLYLIQNKNIAPYRDTMYEKIWREGEFEQTRALDLHIQCLHKKLGWHRVVQTVYKIGYTLEAKGEVQR